MTDYKMISRLGLEIHWACVKHDERRFITMKNDEVIKASDLERVLSEAPVVEVYDWRYGDKAYWRTPNLGDTDGTHSALLVGIQPIVKDTAESLLREFVEKMGEGSDLSFVKMMSIRDRAKRLLEGK